MSNPKTIYIDDEQSIENPAGLWTDHRELPSDKEYRLVGECVWEKDKSYTTFTVFLAKCGNQFDHDDADFKPDEDLFCSCGDRIKVES